MRRSINSQISSNIKLCITFDVSYCNILFKYCISYYVTLYHLISCYIYIILYIMIYGNYSYSSAFFLVMPDILTISNMCIVSIFNILKIIHSIPSLFCSLFLEIFAGPGRPRPSPSNAMMPPEALDPPKTVGENGCQFELKEKGLSSGPWFWLSPRKLRWFHISIMVTFS